MTGSDLFNPEQRRAYRSELQRVYRPWRYGALALLVIAFIGSIADPVHERLWALLLVSGAILTIGVIVARMRYNQRRMRGQTHQV